MQVKLRMKLAVLLGAIVGALLFAGLAAAHTPTVVPGAACDHVGATGQHDGQTYRCEQHRGESCPHFHWIYNPDTPKSGRTAWPHPTCPCASTSATPTPTAPKSATPTPTHTASAAASPTTSASIPVVVIAAGGELPVTGSPIVGIVAFGGALLATGALLIAAARTWRRRTA